MTDFLPILSLKELDTEDGRATLAAQFKNAAQSSGFMVMTDHGVDPQLIKDTFEASKRLFSLPYNEKAKYERDEFTNKGYEIIGRQSLYGQAHGGHEQMFGEHHGITDNKEGWMVGPPTHDEKSSMYKRFAHGPNKLPDDETCPGLEKVATRYYETMMALAASFMRVVARSLDQDETYFANLAKDPISAVRLLHYPPQKEPSEDAVQIGAGAHTDFGLTTWLAIPPNSPGLQVWHDEAWHKVTAPENAFVVNVGDLLSDWSGDYKYKSSLHRVVNASPNDRYSIPFFFEGNNDAVVTPLRTAGSSATEEAKIKVEDYIKKKYDFTYVPAA